MRRHAQTFSWNLTGGFSQRTSRFFSGCRSSFHRQDAFVRGKPLTVAVTHTHTHKIRERGFKIQTLQSRNDCVVAQEWEDGRSLSRISTIPSVKTFSTFSPARTSSPSSMNKWKELLSGCFLLLFCEWFSHFISNIVIFYCIIAFSWFTDNHQLNYTCRCNLFSSHSCFCSELYDKLFLLNRFVAA